MTVVVLDGKSLSLAEAWLVAQNQAQVEIEPTARQQVKRAYELLMAGAVSGTPVYGLTVGVGLNKDHQLFDQNGNLTPEVITASEVFNQAMLRSHCAGSGTMLGNEIVRLAMLIRLNTLLNGQSAVQVEVAELYKEFLNQDICPQIPSQGSMGEADIMLASHIGLVMMGEWQASYGGEILSGEEVLKLTKLKPLVPRGKDGLAILSSNCISTAYGIVAARASRNILTISPLVFGLSLEGLNGNIAPFLPQPVSVRPFPYLKQTAEVLRQTLKGSYLWEVSDTRALQDPLSYRTTVYTLAEGQSALVDLEEKLVIQINSSDDNPSVIEGASQEYQEFSQVAEYFIRDKTLSGGIFPAANFNSLPIALAIQRLSLALAHISHNCVQRNLRLEEEQFTNLPRFLTVPENKGHGFGSLHVPVVALHSEIVDLANPISLSIQAVAGGVEDTGSNTLQGAQRLEKISHQLLTNYGIEMMHASQAVTLRRDADNQRPKLSILTSAFYEAYQEVVPFVTEDRIFTRDIQHSKEFLMAYAEKVESL